ncbi:glycosyltransferase [Falsigemmobacter faecalis]|uniref:Colanic acid biosynthesis glycosyltransferase WcaL n=1 Tax=Falsigemmobacter faecalis TaxID=2488730 RepID=A0A3P3DW16_9RHOB|nr:glycosyltransferase [Falsigemmobacter faecalis]RRH77936.1 colanic acid biosynthesis glycosyltransferase WcaL [Falsigemmobacter faecalis]
MKIAYVLNTYPSPSHSFIRREIRALEAQGHEVLRLAMRADSAPLKDAGDREEATRTRHLLREGAGPLLKAMLAEARGVAAALPRAWAAGKAGSGAGVPGTGGRLRHLIYLAEAARVAQIAKAEGASHLHAHFGTNAAMVAHLAHQISGLPYSFTLHGPEEFDAPLPLSLPAKIASAKFVAAISDFGRSQLMRWSAPEDWQRLEVVHCGIEPLKFASPLPLPEGRGRMVSIGRLSGQKGQLLLIEALALAAPRSADLHLTLVGDGALRVPIEAAIARHGLQDRVTLTGWLDEAGVRAELARAHALVLPSFAEGLPMVVMEAMAAARPVLATYIAGLPELVLPGATGWLIPAGDAAGLSAAMLELAQTPAAQLEAMGLRGRERVLQRHDIAREAAKLAAAFAR